MSDKFTRFLPLHGKDYRGDTAHLTLEQHGAYILLLIDQWDKGKILCDDKNLRRVLMGAERTDAVQEVIQEFFVPDPHGSIQNMRLAREREHAKSIYERKVNAAKRVSAERNKKVDVRPSEKTLHKVNKDIDMPDKIPNGFVLNDPAVAKEYSFAGEVVRLKSADYVKFKSLYANIDLDHELKVADAVFANEPPKDGKWYMPLMYKLQYQNKKAAQSSAAPAAKKSVMRGAI
jgi:uncharacterized protein YdaU (DUF1376 family)